MSLIITAANFLESLFNPSEPVSDDGQNTKTTVQTQTETQQTQTGSEDYVVKPGDKLSRIAEKRGITQQTILRDNPQVKNPNRIYAGQHLRLSSGEKTVSYTVKAGDNLSEIAKKYHTTVGDILRANAGKIAKQNLIFPGQKLNIPVKANVPTHQPHQPTTQVPGTKHPTGTPTTKTPTAPQTPAQTKPTTQAPATTNGVSAGRINIDEFLSPDKGSSALAAIVIGNAEGNRTPDGKFVEPNYYGHKDPGDGLWNIGSFSRANERFPNEPKARTPEEADRLHLQHMQKAKVEY
ncbi:MAG: LysM domain-containing protein, partial [Pyrinomonadaceae bacterium]